MLWSENWKLIYWESNRFVHLLLKEVRFKIVTSFDHLRFDWSNQTADRKGTPKAQQLFVLEVQAMYRVENPLFDKVYSESRSRPIISKRIVGKIFLYSRPEFLIPWSSMSWYQLTKQVSVALWSSNFLIMSRMAIALLELKYSRSKLMTVEAAGDLKYSSIAL